MGSNPTSSASQPSSTTSIDAGGAVEISDEKLMEICLEEAEAARGLGDVPIGALVVYEGAVIARRHNEREHAKDPTAHAELLCLKDAATARSSWRLNGCSLYTTLEPCLMCAGALVAARVDRIVFGAFDPKAGAVGSLYNLAADPRLNHEIEVVSGVRAHDCAEILRQFFADRR